jgi:hypothetical protein
VSSEGELQPAEFRIESVHPNPFNKVVNIDYQVDHASTVRIRIIDTRGRAIADFTQSHNAPGEKHLIWQAENATAGVYFIVLDDAGRRLASKAVYLP